MSTVMDFVQKIVLQGAYEITCSAALQVFKKYKNDRAIQNKPMQVTPTTKNRIDIKVPELQETLEDKLQPEEQVQAVEGKLLEIQEAVDSKSNEEQEKVQPTQANIIDIKGPELLEQLEDKLQPGQQVQAVELKLKEIQEEAVDTKSNEEPEKVQPIKPERELITPVSHCDLSLANTGPIFPPKCSCMRIARNSYFS